MLCFSYDCLKMGTLVQHGSAGLCFPHGGRGRGEANLDYTVRLSHYTKPEMVPKLTFFQLTYFYPTYFVCINLFLCMGVSAYMWKSGALVHSVLQCGFQR